MRVEIPLLIVTLFLDTFSTSGIIFSWLRAVGSEYCQSDRFFKNTISAVHHNMPAREGFASKVE
jgi:hypothetical protein